jgi:hypothetical protein
LQVFWFLIEFLETPLDVAHFPKLFPQHFAEFLPALTATPFQQSRYDIAYAVDVAAHLFLEGYQ